MTYDAPGRLYVVTGNHVVDPHPVLPPDGGRAPEPTAAGRRPVRLPVLPAVGAALTALLVLLGRQPWQLPVRDGGGLADVPPSLVSFLVLCAGTCLWAAGRLTRPAEVLRSRDAVRLWWGLLAGSAAVSVAAALSLASFAGTGERPAGVLVRCLVPVVPALLAGLIASDAGRAARVRLAVGTGLVTLPLGALGWALLSSSAGSAAGPGDVLAMTVLSVLCPLALAVAFVAADRRSRCGP